MVVSMLLVEAFRSEADLEVAELRVETVAPADGGGS
jgi:hypothetical protein